MFVASRDVVDALQLNWRRPQRRADTAIPVAKRLDVLAGLRRQPTIRAWRDAQHEIRAKRHVRGDVRFQRAVCDVVFLFAIGPAADANRLACLRRRRER